MDTKMDLKSKLPKTKNLLPPKLFGVNLPQTNRLKLRNQIRNLLKGQKATLYFFYSEFLLRANRNPAYQEVLNRGILSAIDGKGLHWSMRRIIQPSWLPILYTKFLVRSVYPLRVFVFVPLFALKLVWNILLSTFCLIFNLNLSKKTDNELILGRDFSYDLLTLAEENTWKVLVIGGSGGKNNDLRSLINRLYPSLELDIWSMPPDSDLMRDKPAEGRDLLRLNTDNLFEYFPDLAKAKTHVDLYKPDLILVCLGGASGKQEFFIDQIYRDDSINFTLATGLGAALDHLGAGAKQPKAPRWLLDHGLEWLYRFLTQPYRRKRILDSIFTLWWWTSLQEFMPPDKASRQFINIIRSEDDKFLVQKTPLGYEFLMVPVSTKDSIKKNFQKITLRTGLNFKLMDFDPKPSRIANEKLPVGWKTFAKYLFKYSAVEPYLCQVYYTHQALSGTFADNLVWIELSELPNQLTYQHAKYWRSYIEILNYSQE